MFEKIKIALQLLGPFVVIFLGCATLSFVAFFSYIFGVL